MPSNSLFTSKYAFQLVPSESVIERLQEEMYATCLTQLQKLLSCLHGETTTVSAVWPSLVLQTGPSLSRRLTSLWSVYENCFVNSSIRLKQHNTAQRISMTFIFGCFAIFRWHIPIVFKRGSKTNTAWLSEYFLWKWKVFSGANNRTKSSTCFMLKICA
jgi:hypothetical protein